MAERIETREVVDRDTNVAEPSAVDDTEVVRDQKVPSNAVAARTVWLVAGVIMSLLAIRFLLSLLGANRENGFANLIYTLTYPFAAPFFGLFGYTVQYGRARFEFETLVAIAIYALLALLIAKIVTIRSRAQY